MCPFFAPLDNRALTTELSNTTGSSNWLLLIASCHLAYEYPASKTSIAAAMSDAELLNRLSALDTNTISDALDFLGSKGATVGVRPLWGCPKIV